LRVSELITKLAHFLEQKQKEEYNMLLENGNGTTATKSLFFFWGLGKILISFELKVGLR